MLNPYSKFKGFMLRGLKDIQTCIMHLSSVIVQCFISLAQAVTSQADPREPLKRVFIVIMPKYLFALICFRMNLVNLIQKNYSINDTLGFENSACDVTGSFPIPQTRKWLKKWLFLYWLCLSMRIKYHNKTYFAVIISCQRVP